MYTVITTVGASLFTNYQDFSADLNDDIERFDSKSESEYTAYQERIKKVHSKVMAAYPRINSAELKSLFKIRDQYKNIQVHLISTHTIISRLAAEIIKDILEKNQITVFFTTGTHVIKDLKIDNSENFKKLGLPNLISRIHQITGSYYDNVLFNITGGYKGVIPFLTLLASVHGSHIVYIYEDTENLITIPRLPIKIDESIFDNHLVAIQKLLAGIENYMEAKNKSFSEYDKLENNGLVETDGQAAFLSPIGQILYNRYLNNQFIFCASDDVFHDINKDSGILELIKNKFSKKEMRENKTEIKNNGHRIYDDGDNPKRIFYWTEVETIYIYKVFSALYDDYTRYRNETVIDENFKNNYRNQSRLRIIKLT